MFKWNKWTSFRTLFRKSVNISEVLVTKLSEVQYSSKYALILAYIQHSHNSFSFTYTCCLNTLLRVFKSTLTVFPREFWYTAQLFMAGRRFPCVSISN